LTWSFRLDSGRTEAAACPRRELRIDYGGTTSVAAPVRRGRRLRAATVYDRGGPP